MRFVRTLKNSLLLVVTIEIHGIKISNIEIYNSDYSTENKRL